MATFFFTTSNTWVGDNYGYDPPPRSTSEQISKKERDRKNIEALRRQSIRKERRHCFVK